MSKLVITQEQADAIEEVKRIYIKNITETRQNSGENRFPKWIEDLFVLSDEEIYEALFESYEINPEYKVGDWVLVKGMVGKIINEYDGYNTNGEFCLDVSALRPYKKDIERHATPEEIAEEKQRRFWRENDREIGEYRLLDLLKEKHMTGVQQIRGIHKSNSGHCDVYILNSNKGYTKKSLLENFEVTCFSHDRKDISKDITKGTSKC